MQVIRITINVVVTLAKSPARLTHGARALGFSGQGFNRLGERCWIVRGHTSISRASVEQLGNFPSRIESWIRIIRSQGGRVNTSF